MLNPVSHVSPCRASCTWRASAAWRKARRSSSPSRSRRKAWSRSESPDRAASTVWAAKGDPKGRRSRSGVQREISKSGWEGKTCSSTTWIKTGVFSFYGQYTKGYLSSSSCFPFEEMQGFFIRPCQVMYFYTRDHQELYFSAAIVLSSFYLIYNSAFPHFPSSSSSSLVHHQPPPSALARVTPAGLTCDLDQ